MSNLNGTIHHEHTGVGTTLLGPWPNSCATDRFQPTPLPSGSSNTVTIIPRRQSGSSSAQDASFDFAATLAAATAAALKAADQVMAATTRNQDERGRQPLPTDKAASLSSHMTAGVRSGRADDYCISAHARSPRSLPQACLPMQAECRSEASSSAVRHTESFLKQDLIQGYQPSISLHVPYTPIATPSRSVGAGPYVHQHTYISTSDQVPATVLPPPSVVTSLKRSQKDKVDISLGRPETASEHLRVISNSALPKWNTGPPAQAPPLAAKRPQMACTNLHTTISSIARPAISMLVPRSKLITPDGCEQWWPGSPLRQRKDDHFTPHTLDNFTAEERAHPFLTIGGRLLVKSKQSKGTVPTRPSDESTIVLRPASTADSAPSASDPLLQTLSTASAPVPVATPVTGESAAPARTLAGYVASLAQSSSQSPLLVTSRSVTSRTDIDPSSSLSKRKPSVTNPLRRPLAHKSANGIKARRSLAKGSPSSHKAQKRPVGAVATGPPPLGAPPTPSPTPPAPSIAADDTKRPASDASLDSADKQAATEVDDASDDHAEPGDGPSDDLLVAMGLLNPSGAKPKAQEQRRKRTLVVSQEPQRKRKVPKGITVIDLTISDNEG